MSKLRIYLSALATGVFLSMQVPAQAETIEERLKTVELRLKAIDTRLMNIEAAINGSPSDVPLTEEEKKKIQEARRNFLEALAGISEILASSRRGGERLEDSEDKDTRENWAKLKNGMTTDEVRNLLGEPQRAEGTVVELWKYLHGEIRFDHGKVYAWN